MKIYFDHVHGEQRDKDFIYSLISADFDHSEWNYAFENGWAPTHEFYLPNFPNKLVWYQSRQTRINIEDYSPSRKSKLLVRDTPVTWEIKEEVNDIHSIYELYLQYCEYKGFSDIAKYDYIKQYFTKSQPGYFIHFYLNNQLIAITKISIWNASPFAEFFWWNYSDPSLSVGKLSSYIEIQFVKKLHLSFLYLGLAYNSDSIYKSLKRGFQWWTGRYWSNNIEEFRWLCEQDDKIKTIDDLYTHQLNYLEKLKWHT